MKRSRFTEKQIVAMLREQEGGVSTADFCRRHGVSSATFYKWKAKYGGLEVSDAKRLRALEDENANPPDSTHDWIKLGGNVRASSRRLRLPVTVFAGRLCGIRRSFTMTSPASTTCRGAGPTSLDSGTSRRLQFGSRPFVATASGAAPSCVLLNLSRQAAIEKSRNEYSSDLGL